ncbi:PTS system glucose-specific IIA component [Breznakia sp. PF5-3]|uniref:PTS sugar transporter subunit IIA n=1 Tax=unclassified Breznakia TaxID=2623764 RepID=UPI0024051710|nr:MULTISPECIES: PTS glucose transporter subunit IIA [unclassified Breznakia]MDF9823969.1 PTS system glucose-specific IIA component [Breznakia sp. PM6-1]MDF9834768.1 PTS system glucose-specific IIA component [Breznakia sp. PF5-3]MDF9838376.1 PTS system glucose-specific IIA component [Breznakia sp. PFB2-8]MDF9860392.1 PTS system glucose-specific IIA component [Breznakia sp. PH5-24]
MFKMFKKKESDYNVYSPVDGEAMLLEEVNDQVFSTKMMGEGVGFKLKSGEVCSPCDGKITLIAPTKHAFGIEADNGMEILVHIGLDTVELGGKGFEVLQQPGTRVTKGTAIIRVDLAFMEANNVDLITPMIVTNAIPFALEDNVIGNEVSKGETLIIHKEK